MILKSQALQLFDFLTDPTEKLYERAARFHYKGLKEVLEGKTPYEGEKTLALHYFPEIAAALGAGALKNTALGPAIRMEPMASLRLLATDYSRLAPELEAVVLSSAEATYRLLKEAKAANQTLGKPRESYEAVLVEDTFWALRLYGDNSDEKLLARCLDHAKKKKEASPAAAYTHLYFDAEADPVASLELLSASPMYAYLASRHFYDRGIEFKYFSLRNLTPRWAYHFITDGFLDDEEGLIETMLSSPDWLVEYLVESERYKDLPYVEKLVGKALEKIGQNPLATHLNLWLERVREHVKKLPPPAPAKKP